MLNTYILRHRLKGCCEIFLWVWCPPSPPSPNLGPEAFPLSLLLLIWSFESPARSHPSLPDPWAADRAFHNCISLMYQMYLSTAGLLSWICQMYFRNTERSGDGEDDGVEVKFLLHLCPARSVRSCLSYPFLIHWPPLPMFPFHQRSPGTELQCIAKRPQCIAATSPMSPKKSHSVLQITTMHCISTEYSIYIVQYIVNLHLVHLNVTVNKSNFLEVEDWVFACPPPKKVTNFTVEKNQL